MPIAPFFLFVPNTTTNPTPLSFPMPVIFCALELTLVDLGRLVQRHSIDTVLPDENENDPYSIRQGSSLLLEISLITRMARHHRDLIYLQCQYLQPPISLSLLLFRSKLKERDKAVPSWCSRLVSGEHSSCHES